MLVYFPIRNFAPLEVRPVLKMFGAGLRIMGPGPVIIGPDPRIPIPVVPGAYPRPGQGPGGGRGPLSAIFESARELPHWIGVKKVLLLPVCSMYQVILSFELLILGMMDRKGDDQTSSRTTRRAIPWRGWKDVIPFSIHHTLNLKFRSFFSRFSTENLLITTFKPQFLPQTRWLPIWISEPKFPKNTYV